MFQPASVSLSGPAFSFLLYETCKGSVRQNGFLLGEIVHKEIISITDNEQKQVDISKIIKINSIMPCPNNNYFAGGRVDKEKLHRFLGPNFSKVVAWYKCEPFSGMKFTLKDRALHKQFKELFEVPPDLFSFCFLSMECTDNCASYNYQQSFIRYSNGVFDRLSIYIPNLSEANSTYKNSEPASAVFNKILSTIKMDIENTKGVVAVTEIENAVQKYIISTAAELARAEKTMYELELEIQHLNYQKQFQVSADANANIRSSMDGSSDELNTLDDEPSSEIVNSVNVDKRESSPEITRRTISRTRSKAKKKADVVDMEVSEEADSNKKEETIQNNIQSSPEAPRKSSTPKTRGRGRGKKKT